MSFTNQTTHYGLPQWIGSDKPTYLVDQNNAYQTIDSEIYNANVTAGQAVTTANGASSTAGAASATAADALSAAQTASTTADSALTEAQTANTNAQAAQTAAGAAQSAAQAAQEAAAGNSITNLAPAYDPTIPYAVDALVTQDGKLYKCIVAVTSPEQFDINKWDDVTTSEVYARANSTVISDIIVDSNGNLDEKYINPNNNKAVSFVYTKAINKLTVSNTDNGSDWTHSNIVNTVLSGESVTIGGHLVANKLNDTSIVLNLKSAKLDMSKSYTVAATLFNIFPVNGEMFSVLDSVTFSLSYTAGDSLVYICSFNNPNNAAWSAMPSSSCFTTDVSVNLTAQ